MAKKEVTRLEKIAKFLKEFVIDKDKEEINYHNYGSDPKEMEGYTESIMITNRGPKNGNL